MPEEQLDYSRLSREHFARETARLRQGVKPEWQPSEPLSTEVKNFDAKQLNSQQLNKMTDALCDYDPEARIRELIAEYEASKEKK